MKKQWAGALQNAAVLCKNHCERVQQFSTSPSKEEEEDEEFEEEERKGFGCLETFVRY